MLAEPGVEVLRSLEVEQGNREGLKRGEGERLDAGLLAGGQDAEAVLEQAKGDANGFGLAAFLAALLAAQPEDLAVGHAAREGGNGIPPKAQTSGTVRHLKRDTKIAEITSSISAARPVPAASARIAFE